MTNFEKFISLLKIFLAHCDPMEKQIICLRWGITDGKLRTMEETGEIVKLSKQRIHQVEQELMERFKKLDKDLTNEKD